MDLGTANTIIICDGKIVVDEPSVVALDRRTERMIAVDPSTVKSGYTYEVAYSVLDFEGNISTQKYYIKIK